jgi:ribosome silencing factor RsfS/YbeB/iojap
MSDCAYVSVDKMEDYVSYISDLYTLLEIEGETQILTPMKKSDVGVEALNDSIQKKVSKELKDKPWSIEGNDNAEWVLMDYINVVVHVFQTHKREYYDIESLWGDAKLTKVKSKD